MVKVGRSRNTFLMYDILASDQHSVIRCYCSVFVFQGSINACNVCHKLYQPDKDVQRYCRTCCTWCHVECLEMLPSSGSGTPSHVSDQTSLPGMKLDDDFREILCMPIQRGGDHNIFGNGEDIMAVWKVFEVLRILDVSRVPETWRETISAATFQRLDLHGQCSYYYCGKCRHWV